MLAGNLEGGFLKIQQSGQNWSNSEWLPRAMTLFGQSRLALVNLLGFRSSLNVIKELGMQKKRREQE